MAEKASVIVSSTSGSSEMNKLQRDRSLALVHKLSYVQTRWSVSTDPLSVFLSLFELVLNVGGTKMRIFISSFGVQCIFAEENHMQIC